MKKALDYIASHRSIAITILIAILFVLFVSIPKCSDNIREKKVVSLSLKELLNRQKNELKTEYLADNAEIAKALYLSEEANGKLISKNNKLQKAYSDSKADIALKDTNITVTSDTAIRSQQRTIKGLVLKVSSDSLKINTCLKRLNLCESLNEVNLQSYQTELNINTELQKAVKRTWWEKNDKWIYAGVGIAGTFFILR